MRQRETSDTIRAIREVLLEIDTGYPNLSAEDVRLAISGALDPIRDAVAIGRDGQEAAAFAILELERNSTLPPFD